MLGDGEGLHRNTELLVHKMHILQVYTYVTLLVTEQSHQTAYRISCLSAGSNVGLVVM